MYKKKIPLFMHIKNHNQAVNKHINVATSQTFQCNKYWQHNTSNIIYKNIIDYQKFIKCL